VSSGIDPVADFDQLLKGVAPRDRETVAQALRRSLDTEAELREAAERMAEAQRIARFGNWEWVVAEDKVTWSDELYRIFGLQPGEFAATFDAYIERVHPDDRGWVGELVQQTLQTQEPYLVEHRIVLDDGTARTLRCHGQAVAAEGGEVMRLVGVCQDITELAVAEQARRDAEIRFRNAFEHAPIGVALVSMEAGDESRFLTVNRAMSTITGYRDDELLASSLDEITVPEDRELDAAQRRRLLLGEFDDYSVEKRCQHREGHQMWVQLSFSVARDAEGGSPYGILQLQDISERRRFEQRLRYLADHDPLTGLMNRRRFQVELEQQLAFNARYGGQGSVLIIDIDRFKNVNDTAGHQAGDNLIRRVAELLRERARTSDAVARLAGDEFAVLLPQTDRKGAMQLADDLRTEVSRQVAASGPSAVTVSIGVAMFGGSTAVGAEAILVAADMAMYEAKQEGRDRVALVEDSEQTETRIHPGISTSARIRDALAHDRLLLYRQPIVDIGSGEVVRNELLLRMTVDDEELVPAGRFIEVAEQFGMVQEIDRWVVVEALRLLAGLQANSNGTGGAAPAALHVNLSGSSVTDVSVLEFIERQLDEGDADPSGLTFEITETAAIHNFETAAAFADRITEFGCSIAIDDYGAGFGPFYYLKHLPFDLIKIDGDFVRDLAKSDADQLTVKAIVQIARGLGKQTIAEYVEDSSTVSLLEEIGVDMAQGFHVGKPVAVAEGWD
jgi:diguanylate cyclase (GGDEF)-like protein/PAS domain S-box-containing protein